ncbi:MAG TPA: GNAT family N-acetyltransferase [Chitinophagaceae bacterium]|nr:GNAT family N-acetyltransferase [Chitinophagaceae bacterium]
MVTIIPYQEKYHSEFKRLNLEWLDQYGLTESHDLMVLNDPNGTILSKGGFIWLAKEQDEIAGTVALINEGNGIFELAKMAVAKKWQGRGISRLLMETCLNKLREIGAKKVTLFSNHQLSVALQLYEKYGFRHVEVVNTPFMTADVKMELSL